MYHRMLLTHAALKMFVTSRQEVTLNNITVQQALCSVFPASVLKKNHLAPELKQRVVFVFFCLQLLRTTAVFVCWYLSAWHCINNATNGYLSLINLKLGVVEPRRKQGPTDFPFLFHFIGWKDESSVWTGGRVLLSEASGWDGLLHNYCTNHLPLILWYCCPSL